MTWSPRPDRAVLSVEGPDAVSFLNGLVSNSVGKAGPDRAVFAALLTAQGKWLHDLFILAPATDQLWIDGEAARIDDLKRRLTQYKLRAKVSLTRRDDLPVAVAWGDALPAPGPTATGGAVVADPRAPALGLRLYGVDPSADAAGAFGPEGDLGAWTRLRLSLGIPEGTPDMAAERSILLENGYDDLGAVDWGKGCFIGQELTARTKYRALIKRRLAPIFYDGPAFDVGAPILTADGKEAGEARGGMDGIGLALIKLELFDQEGLACDGRPVRPQRPDWARFPALSDGA